MEPIILVLLVKHLSGLVERQNTCEKRLVLIGVPEWELQGWELEIVTWSDQRGLPPEGRVFIET
jgi:hypothetical protein